MTAKYYSAHLKSYVTIPEDETVPAADACPHCGENKMDWLVWQECGKVRCMSCKREYRLPQSKA